MKWYNYISQIVRMFDKDLHKEYLFCSYLSKLIPAEPSTPWDLENRVKLEYYRLEKTFEGAIPLSTIRVHELPRTTCISTTRSNGMTSAWISCFLQLKSSKSLTSP